MSDYNLFLAGLQLYPSLQQIHKASSYAEEVTIGYVRKIDCNVKVIVEDGDVYIHPGSDIKDLHYNAQNIFDSAFAEMIEKIQAGTPASMVSTLDNSIS